MGENRAFVPGLPLRQINVPAEYKEAVDRAAAEIAVAVATHFEPPAYKAVADAISKQIHLRALEEYKNSEAYKAVLDFQKRQKRIGGQGNE